MICDPDNYHVLAEVNLDHGAESARLDLQVEPGRTLTVNALDPEGKPIGGTTASGVIDLSHVRIPAGIAHDEIHALDASNPAA